jgi:hypothetical protein
MFRFRDQEIVFTQPRPTAEVEAHPFVTRYTDGLSHFVIAMTAPVASGWSVRRVGLAPTGKRRLTTAHTPSGHSTIAVSGMFIALGA